ncbi:hypothetical protein NC653_009262 [Populus alba x Populus x berolinensis]|uniref:F-box domain-containing protein n=1 Tax=Populus alba x Populus x berolinensis TaxID=444605 RepID=A0AAD6R9S6_9ROSI|nr:hypothetical protein NC653_009262 [Populus alba x Populus x berolinensis]
MVEEGTKNHIPEDMVMDIFLKLPVKSIIRFSCASKFWNSLITSPIFIKNHLSKFKQRKQLFLLRTSNPIVSYSLHLDNNSLDRYSQLEFPIQNKADLFEIYGSCNGIVCLPSRFMLINSSKRIIFWNPSIRKTLDLPALRS